MKIKYIALIGISKSGKSYTEQEIRIATRSYAKNRFSEEVILKKYKNLVKDLI